MSHLYLFNPENDLALAHGKAQYTAPPNALFLHNAGAALPFWFCNKGDCVLAPGLDCDWLKKISSLFGLNGELLCEQNLSIVTACNPWGWSLNAKKQFVNCGVATDLLPQDIDLSSIRELSHRRISIEVLNCIKKLMPLLDIVIPCEAKTEDEVVCFAKHHSNIFIKSPWSSSGRGVINSSLLNETELRRRSNGIIRRQGSVMCEKALDKERDFAMLFYSDGKKVRYQGLSLFFNEGNGAYAGNIIAPQCEIRKILDDYSTGINLDELSLNLERILSEVIDGKYQGYLGVDMIIYKIDNDRYSIAPCIEVNLRMTMGVVALLWSQRYLANGSRGVMRVEYNPYESHKEGFDLENLVIDEKKLKSGTISLIPPDKYFSIYISVKNE